MIIRETVNEETGLTAEQEFLKYCKEPRSAKEIKEFFGLETLGQVHHRFIRPLIKEGKIRRVFQDHVYHLLQRYISTEVEDTPELQEKIRQSCKLADNVVLESKVLEFCKTPHTLQEIAQHLDIKFSSLAKRRAVKPLIDEGKLKLKYPNNPNYQWQEYMVTDCDNPQFTEENIIAFCNTPRYKQEIQKYFTTNQRLVQKTVNSMIDDGKLSYDKHVKNGKVLKRMKIVSVLPVINPADIHPPKRKVPLEIDNNYKTVNKKTGLTLGQELLEYCSEPRCILEIQEFLGIRTKGMVYAKFTMPLMKQGKLKFIYPQNPKSTLQRYLRSDIEFTLEMQERIDCEKIKDDDKILQLKALEFCKKPRTMREIKNYLQLGYNEAVKKKVIIPLLNQGKIVLRYPHNPNYQKQQYIIPEVMGVYMQLTNENIIEFCKIPRSKVEIEKHFEIAQDLLYKSINPLIDTNKLIYTKATRVGNKIINRKLISNG